MRSEIKTLESCVTVIVPFVLSAGRWYDDYDDADDVAEY